MTTRNFSYCFLFLFALIISCAEPLDPSIDTRAESELNDSITTEQSSVPALEVFRNRVKLLQEFFDRFNQKKLTDQASGIVYVGKRQSDKRYSLFDEGLMKKSQQLVDSFIYSTDSLILDFTSEKWFAQLNCTGLYNDKAVPLTLTLAYQINENETHEWVIIGGGLFANSDSLFSLSQASIYPHAHETSFEELPGLFAQSNNIFANTNADYRWDQLSVLIFLMHTKALVLKQVDDFSIHFLSLPGWLMTVKEVRGKSMNSGWLITDLDTVTVQQKNDYLIHELHIAQQQLFYNNAVISRKKNNKLPTYKKKLASLTVEEIKELSISFTTDLNLYFNGNSGLLDSILTDFEDVHSSVQNHALSNHDSIMGIEEYLLLLSIRQEQEPNLIIEFDISDSSVAYIEIQNKKYAIIPITKSISFGPENCTVYHLELAIDLEFGKLSSLITNPKYL